MYRQRQTAAWPVIINSICFLLNTHLWHELLGELSAHSENCSITHASQFSIWLEPVTTKIRRRLSAPVWREEQPQDSTFVITYSEFANFSLITVRNWNSEYNTSTHSPEAHLTQSRPCSRDSYKLGLNPYISILKYDNACILIQISTDDEV